MHTPTAENLNDMAQTLADLVYLTLLERLQCLKEGDMATAAAWQHKCMAYLSDLEALLVDYEHSEE